MKKTFECYPDIIHSHIGEIRVTITLTAVQVKKVAAMTKAEFTQFVKENATVHITDFSVDYEVSDFKEWEE